MLFEILMANMGLGSSDFIAAMGGPSVPVGPSGATAATFSLALEALIFHLTHPGSRVIDKQFNTDLFWQTLVDSVDN